MNTNQSTISDVGRKYLRLQLSSAIGPVRLRSLLSHFGSLDKIMSAPPAELVQVDGIAGKTADSIVAARSDEAVDREIDRAQECGLKIVCMEDAEYPKPLLNIPDPPICLYIKGRIEPADSVSVAIVGSRVCSHYGREQAMRFGELLGRAGFTVVSGLARGVDGHGHRGALRVGGRTIAVLGNGLGSVYPPEHVPIAQEIVSGAGALVSELPVDCPPNSSNFPRRNRIIIGLSLGVVVVEAGKRSGALITARLASEYNREVFAVPGRVDRPEYSAGVNALIRDGGAKLVTGLDDVLDELASVGDIMRRTSSESESRTDDSGGDASGSSSPARLNADEQIVLEVISQGLEDAEQICSLTELETARVISSLTSLELKGLVRRSAGNCFALRGSGGGSRSVVKRRRRRRIS